MGRDDNRPATSANTIAGRVAACQGGPMEATDESTESTAMLTFAEARVLGCLIEKESTTPDYYPLTIAALTTACNQKSNRAPVVEWDETTVEEAMAGIRR